MRSGAGKRAGGKVGKRGRKKKVLSLLVKIQVALLGQLLKAILRANGKEGYGKGQVGAQA